ncbi:MAG TPA: RIP metalloprotease RseP [Candidatus Kapabacteria bacterium]|nr:RIP metalloprotease RseP [Candidatus Kapabacteria bacterium]
MEHLILAQVGLTGVVSVLRALLFFVIVIFVLVTFHEFGHFIAGRLFGMRVPVFSIGFGRRLFGFNKISGFTFGPLDPEVEMKLENHTDYRLSPIPVGGYAKIEGMIDETTNEALPSEIQPWEFRAKPWWQKSIVISAGVIMNVLLAWGIFSGRNLIYGSEAPATTTVGYVREGSVSAADDVRPGDRILSVDNKTVSNWNDVDQVLTTGFGHDFSIHFERNGTVYSALYRSSDLGGLQEAPKRFGLEPVGLTAPVLDSVIPTFPASIAGLKKGDTVAAIDGVPIVGEPALIDEVSSHPLKPITFDVVRAGEHKLITVTPDAKGLIGVVPFSYFAGPKIQIRYGLLAAIGLGWTNLWTYTRISIIGIGEIIKGTMPVTELGGPVKIAQLSSQSASGGLESFLMFMALLSVSLALLNILPIPALDGGHLLIILVEASIGHELSQRFKLNFQKIGIAVLLFFLIFVTINDIRGL